MTRGFLLGKFLQYLAERFETIHVREYGRTYTESFGTAVENEDLLAIGHRGP